MGDIPSDFKLLHLIPVFRVSRAVQIFVLEFIKDGLADVEYAFTDGGAASQPIILQGGVRSPVARCLNVIASFNPTSKGFLK